MKIEVFPLDGCSFETEVHSIQEVELLLGGRFLGGFYDLNRNVLVKIGSKEQNPHFKKLGFTGVVALVPFNWSEVLN